MTAASLIWGQKDYNNCSDSYLRTKSCGVLDKRVKMTRVFPSKDKMTAAVPPIPVGSTLVMMLLTTTSQGFPLFSLDTECTTSQGFPLLVYILNILLAMGFLF